MLSASTGIFFIAQLSQPALIGQFNRIVDRWHPSNDASEINPTFTRIETRIAGQLDHAFAGVGEARQTIGNMQKVDQLSGDTQQFAQIARADAAEGVRIGTADQLLPALQAAISSGKPTVLDVPMINNPTPTTGHWNILDIYSPSKDVNHVST